MQHGTSHRSVALYCDRSTGRFLPRVLEELGFDVTSHYSEYKMSKRMPDSAWIKRQTKLGRVLLTCDKLRDMKASPAQRDYFIASGARVFVLSGSGTKFDMLRGLLASWSEIEKVLRRDAGPFIYMVHQNGKLGKRFPEP